MMRMFDTEGDIQLSLMDILLDETICAGKVCVRLSDMQKVGGMNARLKAKRVYELLLRMAVAHPLYMTQIQESDGRMDADYVILEDASVEDVDLYGWQTDCYVLAKYSQQLQQEGYFDAAVSGVLESSKDPGKQQEIVAFLQEMLARTPAYYQIDDATRPILIHVGDHTCHSILRIFAFQLGKALEALGQQVEYYDLETEGLEGMIRLKNQHYRVVIGVQTFVFSIKMINGKNYLHEYVGGMKFNFLFDHPIWFRDHLKHQLKDFYILTLDKYYVDFLEKYYHTKAVWFPPAGMEPKQKVAAVTERKYGVSFVGFCGDYRENIFWIHQLARPGRFYANRFLSYLRTRPDLSAEAAFQMMLDDYGMELPEDQFLEKMHKMRKLIYGVIHHYRVCVIKKLLDSGIQVDVFGDSWKKSELSAYPNLICHPDVTVEEGVEIWGQSRLSLNVMSWHKAGFTERMAGIMMAGAVLVTDDTEYIHGRYTSEDMLVFHLDDLDSLPERVKAYLEDDELCRKTAENGQRKTLKEHTWEKRAEQLLELMEKLENETG